MQSLGGHGHFSKKKLRSKSSQIDSGGVWYLRSSLPEQLNKQSQTLRINALMASFLHSSVFAPLYTNTIAYVSEKNVTDEIIVIFQICKRKFEANISFLYMYIQIRRYICIACSIK